jgi:hypothetical protein
MVAGKVASAVLLVRATASPPLGALPVSVPEQAVVPGAGTFEGAHETLLSETDAIKLTGLLTLRPFNVAVSAAVWLPVTVPAEIPNVAVPDPVPIVTLEGTVRTPVLVDNNAVKDVDAAGLRVKVQVAFCPVPRLFGEHIKLLGTVSDDCASAMVPPDAEVEYETNPVASLATTRLIEIGMLVLWLAAEIITVAVAISPLEMVLALRSNITQVVEPAKLEQVTFLGTPRTTTLVTSAG